MRSDHTQASRVQTTALLRFGQAPEESLAALKAEIRKARRRGSTDLAAELSKTVANLHLARDEFGTSLRWFRRHLRLHPESGHGYWGAGVCLREMGRLKEARRFFARSLELGYREAEGFLQRLGGSS